MATYASYGRKSRQAGCSRGRNRRSPAWGDLDRTASICRCYQGWGSSQARNGAPASNPSGGVCSGSSWGLSLRAVDGGRTHLWGGGGRQPPECRRVVGAFEADRQSDRHLGSRRCRKGSAIWASPAPQNGPSSSSHYAPIWNSCDKAGADDRRLAGRCPAEGTAPRDSPSERARIADRLRSLSRPDPERSRAGFPTAVQEAPFANAGGQRPYRAAPRRLSLARATAGRGDRRLPLPPVGAKPSRTTVLAISTCVPGDMTCCISATGK